MTELAAMAIAGGTSVATGVATVFAVIDPSIPTIVLALIGAIVTITTVVFAFKTASLNAKIKAQDEKQKMQDDKIKAQDIKVAEVIKTTDGMKDALVRETAKASLAEGVVKGQRAAAAEAAIHAAGVLEGQQSAAQPLQSTPPILNKIEKNTADTAENTTRTDAAVQAIKEQK